MCGDAGPWVEFEFCRPLPTWDPDVVEPPPSRARKLERGEGVKLGVDRMVDVRSPPEKMAAITSRNTARSPLLKLPAELRVKILKLVFGSLHVVVDCGKDRRRTDLWDYDANTYRRMTEYGALKCTVRVIIDHDDPADRRPLGPCWVPSLTMVDGKVREGWVRRQPPEPSITAVHLVCRQLYQEAALFQYAIPLFTFVSYHAVSRWLKQLRPVHKRAVTSLGVGRYRLKACHLRELSGLKVVYERYARDEDKAKVWEEWGVEVRWNSYRSLGL